MKSWSQHPTKQQLYSHLPLITKTIQVRWNRHAEHCWRSKDELISDIFLWTLSHKLDGQLEHIYSSSVPIQDVACRERWTIETGGERGSGRSVLAAWHHDDTYIYIYIYIYNSPRFFLVQSAGGVEFTDCPNECPVYDTKQSDGEVPAMLELWGMRSTPSLPSLPDPLWPGVVAPDRALSMG